MRLSALMLILGLIIASVGGIAAQGDDSPLAPPADVDLPITALSYTADFSDSTTWTSGTAPDFLEYGLTADGLAILSTDGDSGIGMMPPVSDSFLNFYTEFSFTIDSCTADTSALLFSTRLDDTSVDFITADQYVFVVQCDGSYRSRPISGGIPSTIDVSGVADGEFGEGSTHNMGVLLQGSLVTWYLDGLELASYAMPATMARQEGVLSFGAQLGMGYTVTQWRIWDIEAPTNDGSTNDDPLSANAFTGILFDPEFIPPSDELRYGLNLPVARYVNPNGIVMFNNDDTAIMDFPQVNQADYYVEIQFVVRSCGEDSLVGLVWRASDDLGSFYVFGVQCDGNYRARAVLDGVPQAILAEGQVPRANLINSGLSSISVYVQGDTAWLYFNQVLLASIPSDALASGISGILLQSAEAGNKMDIIVTDIGILGVE